GLAWGGDLGDGLFARRRGSVDLLQRYEQARIYQRLVVPDHLIDLGTVRSAWRVPGHVRDGPQLSRLEAARGPLPAARRAVHRGRPDGRRQAGALTPIRRTRGARNTASRMSLTIIPAA